MTNLTDQQKSVLLAKVMGWRVSEKIKDQYGNWFVIVQEKDADDWLWLKDARYPFSLYREASMALAWRVLNWAWKQHDRMVVTVDEPDVPLKWWTWWLMNVLWKAGEMEPAEAIRHILDSILSLAIEAGLIEVDE